MTGIWKINKLAKKLCGLVDSPSSEISELAVKAVGFNVKEQKLFMGT